MRSTLTSIALCTSLVACSSIHSYKSDSESPGLYYYMPKKDFVVTITTKGAETPKVTYVESVAYPDFTVRYRLEYSRNVISKNTMNIGVNEKGLLTSATTDLLSGVSDTAKAIASVAGTVTAFNAAHAPLAAPRVVPPALPAPCADGDHVFVFAPEKGKHDFPSCGGLTVTIERLTPGDLPQPPNSGSGAAADSKKNMDEVSPGETAGVYYRQNEPYMVRVTGGIDTAAILFSPSQSATHFLPVAKTFFSDNHADLGFSDGVPTKYKLDSDGELVGLFKLPADVVAAYFSAMGTVFASFKTSDTSHGEALDANTKLQLAKQKYDACLVAIKANDAAAIAKLSC